MLTAPSAASDDAAFERLVHAVDEAGGTEVDYDIAAPKHAFFRFLLERRPVLLHGTGDPGIERFEPQRQTDYDNKWTNAVFATDDPIWPIFFATVNRPVARSLINAAAAATARATTTSPSARIPGAPTRGAAAGSTSCRARRSACILRAPNG